MLPLITIWAPRFLYIFVINIFLGYKTGDIFFTSTSLNIFEATYHRTKRWVSFAKVFLFSTWTMVTDCTSCWTLSNLIYFLKLRYFGSHVGRHLPKTSYTHFFQSIFLKVQDIFIPKFSNTLGAIESIFYFNIKYGNSWKLIHSYLFCLLILNLPSPHIGRHFHFTASQRLITKLIDKYPMSCGYSINCLDLYREILPHRSFEPPIRRESNSRRTNSPVSIDWPSSLSISSHWPTSSSISSH